ncbi:keywimysin-related RiPP [Amycolatopsis anabasis]|nr:keywimysin-related RiPP [Amycolatopsis anabasis]
MRLYEPPMLIELGSFHAVTGYLTGRGDDRLVPGKY